VTYDQLMKGQKMLNDIDEIEKFIGVLENGYVNTMTGFDYSHGKDGRRISFDLNGELRDMVINYLRQKLKVLKAEFEEL
jgi:hypothetical protein